MFWVLYMAQRGELKSAPGSTKRESVLDTAAVYGEVPLDGQKLAEASF